MTGQAYQPALNHVLKTDHFQQNIALYAQYGILINLEIVPQNMHQFKHTI